MSKSNRGKGIWDKIGRGRGVCPICKRSGIKLLYEKEINEKKIMICKQCKAALAHGKKQEEAALI